jgi:iron only hydrogenase large subunit-like protein
VDVVLTTREFSRLIQLYGIDMHNIEPQTSDSPFGIRSSASKLFGASGGTTEAILRTLHFKMTGKEMSSMKYQELRMVNGVKEVAVKIGGKEINIVIANGFAGIRNLMDGILNKTINAHFIEIMACPGGCVNGGGQPFKSDDKDVKARMRTLYDIDEIDSLKVSHKNPLVMDLYEKYLEKPGSDKAKRQLHTCYSKRDVLL